MTPVCHKCLLELFSSVIDVALDLVDHGDNITTSDKIKIFPGIEIGNANGPDHLSSTGLAVVLQGLVRPRLRGTELEFWRNSEEARTDRPSQQLRSLNGEWRLMRYFLLTHLCGISHRIWCTLSTICSDAA